MLLTTPYTFVSREHFWKFVNSELAEEFLAEPKDAVLPFRGICYGEEGFRHFFFREKVSGISDLKGKKIRTSDDPVMISIVKSLDAEPVAVAFNELYNALKTGAIDGAEQPIVNYMANAFSEAAPNLLLDGHTLGVTEIIIADTGWDKLNDQQRAWIIEAGKYVQEFNAKLSAGEEARVLDLLREDGVNIVELPDKSEWVKMCRPVIEANIKSNPELYKQLVNMQ